MKPDRDLEYFRREAARLVAATPGASVAQWPNILRMPDGAFVEVVVWVPNEPEQEAPRARQA